MEETAPMHWRFLPDWAAWWLMVPNDGVTEQRGYGPFNETEAVWAGEVHGIPFAAAIRAQGSKT